jgi:hypothetical protein
VEDDVAEGTRAMIPVHFNNKDHVIRFIACHWTALDAPSSRLARGDWRTLSGVTPMLFWNPTFLGPDRIAMS